VIDEIYPLLEIVYIKESTTESLLEIPNIVETKQGFFEEVSDLNGIAIPSFYYDYLYQKWDTHSTKTSNILLSMIRSNIQNMNTNDHIFLKRIVNDIPENIEKIEDYLFVANISLAIQETLYFKLKQIDKTEYNWISTDMMEKCKERMDQCIGMDCENTLPNIEKTILNEKQDELHVLIDAFLETHFGSEKRFRFHARVDVITDNIVWEIKCTNKITVDHMLQMVIYKWLWDMSGQSPKEFKLFNIKTGEILRLEATGEQLNMMVLALLKGKYQDTVVKTEEEFIADCRGCFLG
jgi:hypothetical protein